MLYLLLCVDLNECTVDTAQAEKCEETEHAHCVDMEGSYKCVCDPGYTITNSNITCAGAHYSCNVSFATDR